jgi:hypothetical protein
LFADSDPDAESGWTISPFDNLEIPYVSEGLHTPPDWSDDQKARTLGRLTPLLAAYEQEHFVRREHPEYGTFYDAAGIDHPPDEFELFSNLIPLLSGSIRSVSWQGMDMGASAGVSFFAEDRRGARAEIEALLRELADRLRQLARLVPEPTIYSPPIVTDTE